MDRVELRSKFSSRIEKFRLEEFEVDLYLRRLSAMARAKLGDQYKLLNDNKESSAADAVVHVQCRVVAEGLVDEHGTRLYRDDEVAAIAEEWPATALDQISARILNISGLGTASQEDPAKNSQPTPSADSPSV